MKILQLTCHYLPNIGGVETHLNDLVNELSIRRYEVIVLTYQPLTTLTSAKVWQVIKSDDNLRGRISILRIPWIKGYFYSLIQYPFIEFLYLSLPLFIVLPFIILISNPKVIHAHGLVAGFIGVFWGKIFHKRIIISTHSIYNFPKKGLYTKFVSWVFKNSDAVLCLSNQSKDEILRLGISTVKLHVFTYWINQSLFHKIANAKEKLNYNDTFIVLFVGRLVKEKGIVPLLQAAKIWNSKILLLIIGTGPLEDDVKRYEYKERVNYIGKVSQENLPLYYSAADVLVVPSLHEEGFGRVILESFSCATPVIAAKRGGILEAMNQDVGYFIDITPGNIRKTLEYCYTHRIELEDKSKKAKLYANKRYSKQNIEVILNSYNE